MLEALVSNTNKPFKHASHQSLFVTTSMLFTLTPAKRVGELLALSVNPGIKFSVLGHANMSIFRHGRYRTQLLYTQNGLAVGTSIGWK